MGCGKQLQILLGSFPVFLTFPVAYPSELQGRMVPEKLLSRFFQCPESYVFFSYGKDLLSALQRHRSVIEKGMLRIPQVYPRAEKNSFFFLLLRNSFCSSRYPSGPVSSSPIPGRLSDSACEADCQRHSFFSLFSGFQPKKVLFISMLPVSFPNFHSGQNAKGPQTPGLTPFVPHSPVDPARTI